VCNKFLKLYLYVLYNFFVLDIVDQCSSCERIVVVYLDAAISHRSYRRMSAVEFDLRTWSWVNAFVAKAPQWDKTHFSGISCSESFVRRQFDCGLFSNVGSYQGIF